MKNKRKEPPNNLINADHYLLVESNSIGFTYISVKIIHFDVYPWQVINTFFKNMI